jgi:hypothetical protein
MTSHHLAHASQRGDSEIRWRHLFMADRIFLMWFKNSPDLPQCHWGEGTNLPYKVGPEDWTQQSIRPFSTQYTIVASQVTMWARNQPTTTNARLCMYPGAYVPQSKAKPLTGSPLDTNGMLTVAALNGSHPEFAIMIVSLIDQLLLSPRFSHYRPMFALAIVQDMLDSIEI